MEIKHEIHKEEIEKLIPEDAKEIFTDLAEDKKEGEVLGDIFYNSIKSFFEVGLELASNLNLELLFDKFKSVPKEKGKK